MKVILHIGAHKTGTSFLQSFLFENRELLKKNKILYPESILSGDNHGVFANFFKKPNKEQCDNYLRLLQKEVDEVKPKVLLISSECFLEGRLIAQNFKKSFLIEHDEISLVCYLRPQFDWFTSLYNEIVRDPFRRFTGECEQSREFIGKYYDYIHLISRWVDEYPSESIKLLPYGGDYFLNESLRDDFCIKVLGLKEDFLRDSINSVERVNSTLKAPYVHFLRKANQIPLDLFEYENLVSELNQLSNLDTTKFGSLLSSDLFDTIESLSNNSQLSNYHIKNFPISSKSKPNHFYHYTLEDEKQIIDNLSEEILNVLINNASNYPGNLFQNNTLKKVPEDLNIRVRNVLERQEFELINIYNFGLPNVTSKSIDELIIKQRIYLRECLSENSYSLTKLKKMTFLKQLKKLISTWISH